MTTRAPRANSALVVAKPMPRAAPVIAMVLPVMLSMRPNFTGVKFSREVASEVAIPSRAFIRRHRLTWWFRSAGVGRFECMFDGSLPEIADLSSLSDAELVDAATRVTPLPGVPVAVVCEADR